MGSSGQLYSLSWGEFGSSLASAVQLLRGHGDLVDVTLAAGGRSFAAHKIVLSAASPFLLDLLKSTPCQHPVVMLAGIGAEDLESILEFIYRGEVSVEPSHLPSLLQAAHCLGMHGLPPPTVLNNSAEESPISATSKNESLSQESLISPLAGRKRRKSKRRKSSLSSSGKLRKVEMDDAGNKSDTNMDSVHSDYEQRDEEMSREAGINEREAEPTRRDPSPLIIRPVAANENPQAQDSLSDSEGSHLHSLMPLQPYSPLHIPQFPASLGLGFPPISSITQAQNILAAPAIGSSSSGKIRGASDCPGACPLCGATLRQARNLRRHLVSSCKYRLSSYAGLRNQSPSDSMMIEIKPEVDMAGFSASEGFRIEESNSCEQIVCKPSPLPLTSPHGSNVVSPNKNLSSTTIAR
ncbi:transcription factor GAGA-like [Belonocnema kinseyi]|uniref:transcription factor GAGA-like n=1 Tax=Belonocnema kinseyi TaxID=2817044 RepID=UPI00143D2CAF|nr:transcription factor GAGA-like [Belonocnema kinseyi]